MRYTYEYSQTGSTTLPWCATARHYDPDIRFTFGYGATKAAARADAKRHADQYIHEIEQARAAIRSRDAALLAS